MEMEQRGEQSISLSMSRIAEMATSAVTNRVKDGQIKRDGKERTHGHKSVSYTHLTLPTTERV